MVESLPGLGRLSSRISGKQESGDQPVYADADGYGKTRRERYLDEHGVPGKRIRRLPLAE